MSHEFERPAFPALGLGCWAIGGPFFAGDRALGWGEVDDAVSARAIAAGLDHGVRLFDTAQAYGTGHSETVLGLALKGRDDVAIVTKVGNGIDPRTQQITGPVTDPAGILASLDASRRRLRRDRIDLVLLHLNELPVSEAQPIFETLAGEHATGRIGGFGWSTDFPERAEAFADLPGFVAIEYAMSVVQPAPDMVATVARKGLTGLIRSPLAMGILGGRYDRSSRFGTDDIRGTDDAWKKYFRGGAIVPEFLDAVASVREVLTSEGRTLAQGALAWLWAQSDDTVPIPGFRTPEQVADLCGALDHGPLSPAQIAEIDRLLDLPDLGPVGVD